MIARCCILLLLAFSLSYASSAKAEWQFLHAHDGDTPTLVNEDGQRIKIRVRYIDTPEANQPGCLGAKNLTERLLSKGRVVVTGYKPSHDRLQATLSVNDVDLGTQLVRHGWAWVDPRYSKDETLLALQDSAKRRQVGVWREFGPVPPWEWRKMHGWNGRCDK